MAKWLGLCIQHGSGIVELACTGTQKLWVFRRRIGVAAHRAHRSPVLTDCAGGHAPQAENDDPGLTHVSSAGLYRTSWKRSAVDSRLDFRSLIQDKLPGDY
jgi:hypothetical protein